MKRLIAFDPNRELRRGLRRFWLSKKKALSASLRGNPGAASIAVQKDCLPNRLSTTRGFDTTRRLPLPRRRVPSADKCLTTSECVPLCVSPRCARSPWFHPQARLPAAAAGVSSPVQVEEGSAYHHCSANGRKPNRSAKKHLSWWAPQRVVSVFGFRDKREGADLSFILSASDKPMFAALDDDNDGVLTLQELRSKKRAASPSSRETADRSCLSQGGKRES